MEAEKNPIVAHSVLVLELEVLHRRAKALAFLWFVASSYLGRQRRVHLRVPHRRVHQRRPPLPRSSTSPSVKFLCVVPSSILRLKQFIRTLSSPLRALKEDERVGKRKRRNRGRRLGGEAAGGRGGVTDGEEA
ncbi:hypothetical protein PIB30_020186 [Stylosanthes scabra]|uniref:Uncharacterized protein n=1 Tax=Stylosanthes scabra TaxID=79078 RepID=A0ABU6Q8F2_9FABA|nr:hypothetical protein [Stylosanthes scabra]